jgi:hypothetical protein
MLSSIGDGVPLEPRPALMTPTVLQFSHAVGLALPRDG